ncbi:DUF3592 domain-containing protein [Paenibacillus sp. KACC 21273]|uniref:DUF3592 domain-containing protein n=1 Tax=Paenibacillus sp. KACC 21273 TaxID=3025665 RepID=UPI002365432C|nr:DUF3592 domain-containing protein [Paenibacillus sp. KACC 21273]WDF49761.1 DUF3592 domain-containing protein [Paenibacillus sp. KACC 21273]
MGHWTGRLFTPLLFIIGLFLLYVSWRLLKTHLYRLRHWTRTVGVIIDRHTDIDIDTDLYFDDRDDDDRHYVNIRRSFKVEFYTTTGHIVSFWHPSRTKYSLNLRGTRINILYDPADPQSAVIADGISGGWSKVWFVAFLGVVFLGSGVLAVML